MNITKFYAMLFCSILFSKAVIAVAAPEDRCISDPAQMSRLVRAHSDITTLIVGCGQDPYAWEEDAGSNLNHWRSSKDRGDHTHGDAWTCAETEVVNPNFILDMRQPVSKALKGLFGTVYLEKLPPSVLGQAIVWRNAIKLLRPGGRVIADHQVITVISPLPEELALATDFDNCCRLLISPVVLEALGTDHLYLQSIKQYASDYIKGMSDDEILAARTEGSMLRLAGQLGLQKNHAELRRVLRERLEQEGFEGIEFQDCNQASPNSFNGRTKPHTLVEAKKPGELIPASVVVSTKSPEERAKKQRQHAVKKVKVEGEEAKAALSDFKIKARRSDTFAELSAEFPEDDVGTLLQPWKEDGFYRLPLTDQESVTFKVLEEAPLRLSQVKIDKEQAQ